MNSLVQKVAAMVGVAGAAAAAERPDDKDNPRAKVEFRRAEAKPADGLKAATVAGTDKKVYLHPTAELTEADVAGATVGDGPSVDVALTAAGAKKLEKLSAGHLDRPLAILVDGKVIAAPTVRAKLGGRVSIAGEFTPAEAAKLADAIAGKRS
ncbi:MAG: hypothetical protein K2P78_14295 [Gemmataceae bacterium]|nr:hypothetical protein [Gemmataceae bacterium]